MAVDMLEYFDLKSKKSKAGANRHKLTDEKITVVVLGSPLPFNYVELEDMVLVSSEFLGLTID